MPVSSSLASQLFDRDLIIYCLQQRNLIWYDYQAELKIEVYAWSVYCHKPGKLSIFLSFWEVLDAFVLRCAIKSERVHAIKRLHGVYTCTGIQESVYTVQVRSHKITCNCKLFRCIQNRLNESPDLAKKLAGHEWFAGQGVCHHVMAVLPLIGYSSLADYLEF